MTSDKYHNSHTQETKRKDKKQKTLAEHTRAKKRKEKRPMETLTTEQLVNTMVSSASCTKMVWQWEVEARGWIRALVIMEQQQQRTCQSRLDLEQKTSYTRCQDDRSCQSDRGSDKERTRKADTEQKQRQAAGSRHSLCGDPHNQSVEQVSSTREQKEPRYRP